MHVKKMKVFDPHGIKQMFILLQISYCEGCEHAGPRLILFRFVLLAADGSFVSALLGGLRESQVSLCPVLYSPKCAAT